MICFGIHKLFRVPQVMFPIPQILLRILVFGENLSNALFQLFSLESKTAKVIKEKRKRAMWLIRNNSVFRQLQNSLTNRTMNTLASVL